MNKKKIAIITSAGLLAVFGTVVIGATKDLSYMEKVELSGVSLASVPSGNYTGTFQHGRFTNTLHVAVENHRITGITIEKDVGLAKKEVTDAVFRNVIEAQSTDIDTVSGATLTSNAYLKAIENAFEAH